ncbi:MAG: FAD-binding oxidoreductase [Candidatus Nitrosothermus koennekii]|nr:MAG: FAD-binding oxidoreductase [Candidatus Nitrosothermus koennekii]
MNNKNKLINEFKDSIRGHVLLQDDKDYEEARKIWNSMFDRKPLLIVRCISTRDVINCVNFARDNNLLISVKGGGHNVAGNAVCDDGLMIDLSLMRRVNVDKKNKMVRVDGGALLGDLDSETHLYGLAISGGGIISHTGVGGLTLGGGFGWISRKYGLAVDNLISAEVVTADGRLLTASREENQDLFWAIRGGGGNFGIVTSFKFRCIELDKIYSGLIIKKFENAKEYLQFHRDYVRKLPDEMTIWVIIRHAPPLPFLPKDVHGKMVLVIAFAWLGDKNEGYKLLQPLRSMTESYGENIDMNEWPSWQSGFDALVAHGARNYWKSHHIKELSDECIDAILEYAESMPTDESEIFIPHMEGAPSRVAEAETAYDHRKTPFILNIHARWHNTSDDERCIKWARDSHKNTEQFAQGVYVNFISNEGEDRVKEAYTPEVWTRLVDIKRKYDPYNIFSMNQNIKP